MAEFATTTTDLARSDPERPSFFELVAQDGMMTMLKPALRYFLTILAQRRPQWFGRFFALHEELYGALALVVQWHHLATYDGSFAEVFYGLKRVPVSSLSAAVPNSTTPHGAHHVTMRVEAQASSPPLTHRQRLASLFFLVALPYVKTKLDAWYEAASRRTTPLMTNAGVASGASNDSRNPDTEAEDGGRAAPDAGVRSLPSSAALNAYPFVHAAWEGLHFVHQIAYLFGHSVFYSPTLALCGLAIRRMTISDMIGHRRARASRHIGRVAPAGAGLVRRLLQPAVGGAQALLEYSQVILPIAVFFLKFLEWWYNSAEGASSAQPLPIPPPPEAPMCHADGVSLPSDHTVCPLCRRARVNPSVLLSSGHAFCHKCIHAHVDTHARCPVTLIPASVDQIARIYTGTFA